MEWDDSKKKLLNKVGLLCIALNKDYRRENLWIIDRIEATDGITLETKFKRREIEKNLEIGAFVIDCESRNKKYFKICRIDEEFELVTHAFVDFVSSIVYKPKTSKTANKNLGWYLDDCIKYCDWRGNYLNKNPGV
jgi:hypothetical protein